MHPSITANMGAERLSRSTCGPGRPHPGTAGDHITILDTALVQLPEHERAQVLVRADTGACSKAFLHHVTTPGWSARSGSLPTIRSGPPSRLSRTRRGGQRSTPTVKTATVPGGRTHRLDADPDQADPFTGPVRSSGVAGRNAGHRPS